MPVQADWGVSAEFDTPSYNTPVRQPVVTPGVTAPGYTGTIGQIIPNAGGLEQQSSADIAGLLNPPTMFPDVDRRSAELSAARGVPGSGSGYGTGLRMTDEERIRRIALGENLMSSAYNRNLPLIITPDQQANLNIKNRLANIDQGYLDLARTQQQQRTNTLNMPSVRYGGGSVQPGSHGAMLPQPGAIPGGGAPAFPNYGNIGGEPPLPEGTTFDLFGNPVAPNQGGNSGDISDTDLNDMLNQLGIGDEQLGLTGTESAPNVGFDYSAAPATDFQDQYA